MENQIVRMFDNYDAAQRARSELLAAGFDDGHVRLKARIDEAGPGKSNFTVGNDPDVVGGEAYSRTFAPEGQQGHYLMMVEADDGAQAERAAQICDRYGATSGDPAENPPGRAH
ncbi:MAG: hypothetical protein ACXWC4_04800 [Telluria sp.]